MASEVGGGWQPAQELLSTEFLTDENAEVLAISCRPGGNCAVGGDYLDGSGHRQAYVGDERNGFWEAAQEVPGLAGLNGGGAASVGSVSCASAGNCSAGGDYSVPAHGGLSEAFVVSEKNGAWGGALEAPGAGALNAGGQASADSVSCVSASNCAVVGGYQDKSQHSQVFVLGEAGGRWAVAAAMPGAGGLNTGGNAQPWGVSCASAASCSAVGFYSTAAGELGFLASGALPQTASVALALSATRLTYVQEQRERFTVKASPQHSGVPAGTVTVRAGSTGLCVITLRSGKGGCTLSARKLPA